MMKGAIKANNKALDKAMAIALGKEAMTAIGELGATIIQNRSLQGVDAGGKAFVPYTKEYLKRKAASGRSARPNLTWSGRMLGSIISSYQRAGLVHIIFSRAEEALKALGIQSDARKNPREFFDIRLPREVAQLQAELNRQAGLALKKAGLI